MSSWKKTSLSVLIFSILLLGSITFLIGTTSGIRILFNVANNLVPGLEIGQAIGDLKNLHLKNIDYNKPGITINIADIHLSMKLSYLRYSKLYIDDLSLKDLKIKINSKKISPNFSLKKRVRSSSSLSIPYKIVLHRISLNKMSIKIDDMNVSIMDISSGFFLQNKNLTLTPTLLQGLVVTLPKATNITQKKEEIIKHKIQKTQLQKILLGDKLKNLFSKSISSKIIKFYLPFNLNIEAFNAKQLHMTGQIDLMVFNIFMKGSIIDNNIKLSSLYIKTNQGLVNATGNVVLNNNWPVNITLSILKQNLLKGEKIKCVVYGALLGKLKCAINFSGPINIALNGQTKPTKYGMPLYFEIKGDHFYWPFTGEKQFQADDIKMKISGTITDYFLSFKTAIRGQNIPSAMVNFNAKGNKQQINIDKLIIIALDGKTELTALINWHQSINWQSYLKITGINIAEKVPDWPSRLDGIIKTSGCLYGGHWHLDVPVIKIVGNLKQNKIQINGALKVNDYMQWMITDLYAALGSNSVNIKGMLGTKDRDLNVIVNVTNLEKTLLGISGSAKGLIKIRGTIEALQLLVDIAINDLCWQNLFISKLQMHGNIKYANQIDGRINIRVEDITQSGINIKLIKFDIKGSEKQHDLQLKIQENHISGQLHLTGGFHHQSKIWKGQLNNAMFNTPVGPLTLSHSIALYYYNNQQKISIGPHCWSNIDTELCIPQTISAGIKGYGAVKLTNFNLAMIKPLMPDTTQVIGILSIKANLAWDVTKKLLLQGSVSLSGKNIKITQIINEVPLQLAIDNLDINLISNLNKNYVQLKWFMQLNNNSQFKGQMQLNDLYGQRNLSGVVSMHHFNLAIVNTIYAPQEKINGFLNFSLRLAGNTQNPQLFGQVQLNEININNNLIPFDMLPSQLTLNFNGTNSTLAGRFLTTRGQINLNGMADWSKINQWHAYVIARGSLIRITVQQVASFDISPNIVFEAKPDLLSIDGSIDVPWAHIIVHELPENVVSSSSDEIFLNERMKPFEEKITSIQMNSNLNIHLGNNVQLEAFGLKTKLNGELKVVQNKYNLGLSGQINILEGRFHAYGQDLIVRKGELLFSGPPDQPVLNIEAIHNPDTTEDGVIAGLRVTGSADEPKMEIFSDPIMSQQEAFSYLLRGRRLNSAQSNGATITSMLVGLGVAQSAQIVSKIGEIFGISNLSLDTQGIGNSSQVVVSGYALPGLQVKYGVGIFDSLTTLTLRYRLMPKLYLEVISGVNQTLDLLYQFEF